MCYFTYTLLPLVRALFSPLGENILRDRRVCVYEQRLFTFPIIIQIL
jgi:hypothetical protein